MRALLSFCNEKRAPELGVLLFNVGTGERHWLPVGTDKEIMGTRGVTLNDGFLYVLYTVGWHETHLSIYDLTKNSAVFRCDMELSEVKDPHSLCAYDSRLLIASTGTNQLLAYDLGTHGLPVSEAQALWSPTPDRDDTHHVNCVAASDGHIYVSAFGPRQGEFWSSATDGYIYDVTAGLRILTGIKQPHSLRSTPQGMYFAESSRQMLRTLNGASMLIGGYTRGCDVASDGTVLVGSNVARRISASRGIVVNNEALENKEGEPMGRCCIVCVTPGKVPKRHYIDVSAYGREIYDICLLPD